MFFFFFIVFWGDHLLSFFFFITFFVLFLEAFVEAFEVVDFCQHFTVCSSILFSDHFALPPNLLPMSNQSL